MEKRQQELLELKEYVEKIDKETTLLLQNLQWDHKHLIESSEMVSCKYFTSHRIRKDTREAHERQCYLTQQGYSKEDALLPDPIDPNANTIVKLSKQDIVQIINTASSSNPSFKRACPGPEPLTVERLQQVYTADERRAIHDAVVATASACHDLTDLALISSSDGAQTSRAKSRAEILAELRDMKRRRTKYRVAAKTANYSDMLRDVIKTQMELYAEAKGVFIKTENGSKTYVSLKRPKVMPLPIKEEIPDDVNRKRPKVMPRPIKEVMPSDIAIKQERISPDANHYNEGSRRYRERSRSRDRRSGKQDDRETVSKRRDHYHDIDSSSDNRRYNYFSQERDHDQSKQKHSQRYCEHRRKRSKHDRDYRNDANRYDADSRNYDEYDRRYREETSKDNTKNYSKKREEYQKYSDKRREIHKRHYDVEVKEEKQDYPSERYREVPSDDNSKNYNYNRKREELQNTREDSDRYREIDKRRYDVEVKQEKQDYSNERYREVPSDDNSKNYNYNRKREELQNTREDSDKHRDIHKRNYDVEVKEEKLDYPTERYREGTSDNYTIKREELQNTREDSDRYREIDKPCYHVVVKKEEEDYSTDDDN